MNGRKAAAILFILMGAFWVSQAEQFIFVEDEITWSKNHYDLPVQHGPTNWRQPVNYADGRVYARYEVLEKPSNLNVAVQLCMWQDEHKRESCANCYTYNSKGVYYIDWAIPSKWWYKYPLDYSRAFGMIYLMHKPESCNNNILMTEACGDYCYKNADIDQHVPIKFKVKVIVVSKDGKLVIPPDWKDNPWGFVNNDKTPPSVTRIQSSTQESITLEFNEPLLRRHAESRWSYRITPKVSVLSASLNSTGKTVTLGIRGTLHHDSNYTLLFKDIADLSGNEIADSVKSFRYTGPVAIGSHPFPRGPHAALAPARLVLTSGPMQGSFLIRCNEQIPSQSVLAIYDAAGKQLAAWQARSGETIPWLSPNSGIHFMVLRARGETVARKIIAIVK